MTLGPEGLEGAGSVVRLTWDVVTVHDYDSGRMSFEGVTPRIWELDKLRKLCLLDTTLVVGFVTDLRIRAANTSLYTINIPLSPHIPKCKIIVDLKNNPNIPRNATLNPF